MSSAELRLRRGNSSGEINTKSDSRTVYDLWRIGAAELCGTMLLVLCSGLQPQADGLGRAAAAGLTVASLVHSFVGVSGGQFNPSVTLAALVWGRYSPRRAAVEVFSQLAGGVVGAGLLRVLQAESVTLPAGGVLACRAVVLEAVGGSVLALANCAAWAGRPPDAWPLRIGTVVAALTLITLDSGASMNPARSFGPALVSGVWRDHWIYWVGPLSGATIMAALHRLLWAPPRPPNTMRLWRQRM